MTLQNVLRSIRSVILLTLVLSLLLTIDTPAQAGVPGGRVEINGRRGFDKCYALTASAMDEVGNNSDYWVVGVYIGGINVKDCATNVSYSWISHNGYFGWGFIPIYVGRFAPCFAYSNYEKISTDKNIAITQARNAAKDAEVVASNVGFTRGTVIYLDMEAYNTADAVCRSIVNSYLNEWVRQLKADGYRAGAYGSSCGSAINDWAANQYPPDDVFIADWNGNTDVYAVSCVYSGYWVNSQRHHQYRNITTAQKFGNVTVDRHDQLCSQGHVAGNGYNDNVPNSCP